MTDGTAARGVNFRYNARMDPAGFDAALDLLKRSRRTVAFTGAGASAESGIPTFRGEDGVWVRYPPDRFGTLPGLLSQFLTRPSRLRDFLAEVLTGFLEARPGPTHAALAKMERQGRLRATITQNIDNLHQEAGSRRVVEIHGNLYRFRCRRCSWRTRLGRENLQEILEGLRQEPSARRAVRALLRRGFPRSRACGRFSRPEAVFFGEDLPSDAWEEAVHLARTCELMLVVGTSGTVWPAADLPWVAARAGAAILEVNPEPSEFTASATRFLAGPAGRILERLARRLEGT